jgi:hypothetical protein
MARIPHAAKVLAQQVRDHYGRSADSDAGRGTVTPVGDVDGFGVHREVKFDKTASKWLAPLLEASGDPRIVGTRTEGGQLVVEFTGRVAADNRDPFPLDAAATVAAEQEPQGDE